MKHSREEARSQLRRYRKLRLETLEQRLPLSADSVVNFNEVMYNPGGGDQSLEWIELYNQMSVDIELSNWRIEGGVDFQFPQGTVIGAGEYLVIAADASALQAATGFTGTFGSYDGQLSNGGESLILRDHNDRLLDELEYSDDDAWHVAPDGGGVSLAKIASSLATGEAASWTHSVVIGGTPGAANFAIDDQETVNVLEQWNVDIQGDGGSTTFGQQGTAHPHGPDASGIWNIFNLPPLDGDPTTLVTNPSLNLVDSDGTPSNVTFAFVGEAGGWAGTVGADTLIGDYVIVMADGRLGYPTSLGLRWTGLEAGATYELTLRSAVASHRDMQNTLDIDGDGSLGDETPVTTSGGGATSTFRFTANESGTLVGEFTTAVNNETNLSSFQLQKIEVILPSEPAEVPQLRINEVASAAGPDFFIELFNAGDEPIDLTDYTIASAGSVDDSYTIPSGTVAPHSYWSIDAATLGFQPEDEDRLFLYNANSSAILDAVRAKNSLRGRSDQHDGRWQRADVATPGAANSFSFYDQIVINEIMYHHHAIQPTESTPFADDPEEWIELYNNSGQTIDLSGWELDDAVEFTFDAGTTIAPYSYLVIAGDATALAAKYPSIAIAGEYSGQLSNSGERIQLLDATKNIADEVHYYDGGRWTDLADGNGSSLELRDPDADNSKGEAWGASEESQKSSWETITYTGIATTPELGYNIWDEFIVGLLEAGEVLIDDISVIRDPNGVAVELIQNGTFTSGTTNAWRLGGNHRHSQVVPDPDDPSNNVLKLSATGATEHILNHAETTLAGGESIQPGTEYQISFRAKWLSGSNQVNTRLYFNYLPKTTRLTVPGNNGTPGAANSQAEANIGPTYEQFQHGPVTPTAGESVTISVVADDPDGVASMVLKYSVNEGGFANRAMTHVGGGRYEGVIPGQATNAIVQFYVEGTDTLGATSTFPAAGADSRALYKVGSGSGVAGLNRLQIIMLPSDSSLMHDPINTFSNESLGATVVSNNSEVFYDVKSRMKGSAYGRNNNFAKGFRIEFNPEQLYRGVHDNLTINRDGLKELIAKHLIASAGGIPSFYDDVIDFGSASGSYDGRAVLNMARYSDIYLDSQFEEGSDGNLFNMETLYIPTTTQGGGVEDPKFSFPYTHNNGLADFTNYGPDPELYRHTFQLERNNDRDDFSGLISFLSIFDLPDNELSEQAPLHMDVDQWVRTFAAQSLHGTDDTYTRTPTPHHAHNLRFFERPEDGLFIAMPWDLDRSFNLSTSAPLWGFNGTLPNLFELPTVRRLFYGHLDHLIQTTYNSAYLSSWATHYGSKVGQNFTSQVNYVDNRANYVLSQLPSLTPFNITTNGGNGFSTSEGLVTLEGTGSYKIRSLKLGDSADPLNVVWTSETTWQVTIPLGPGANLLDIKAIDYLGNEIHSDSITVSSSAATALADATNLRVTEVHYNPAAPSASEISAGFTDNEDFEFFELLNTSGQTIELQQVVVSDGVEFTFTNSTLLAAGERAVMVEDVDAFQERYGTSIRILGQWSGQLSNGGETLTLTGQSGQLIQSFTYIDDDDPGEEDWPTTPDGGGPSLVVVDTEGDYDDGTNWRASTTIGGTPGADEVAPPSIPGDYDSSGTVDQADYSLWKSTFGSTTDLRADGNGDNIVDAADYVVWRNNLGRTQPAALIVQAPQATPSALFVAADGRPVGSKLRSPSQPNQSTPQDVKSYQAVHSTDAAFEGVDHPARRASIVFEADEIRRHEEDEIELAHSIQDEALEELSLEEAKWSHKI